MRRRGWYPAPCRFALDAAIKVAAVLTTSDTVDDTSSARMFGMGVYEITLLFVSHLTMVQSAVSRRGRKYSRPHSKSVIRRRSRRRRERVLRGNTVARWGKATTFPFF